MHLTPFLRTDFDRLISWVPTSELLMQWTGLVFRHPLTTYQLDAHLSYAEENPGRRKIWNALEADVVVGHIELNNIWEHDRKASICRVIIDPDARGRSLGRKMVQAALKFGFANLKLHRIELGVWDFNQSAIRCYEACGFVQEGMQRECRRMGDGWWNGIQMAILEQEWNGENHEGYA